MRRVLIDTNIYTAFKAGDFNVAQIFRHLDFIGINITVLAELYSGFKSGRMEKQNILDLEEFINSPRVNIININKDAAYFYAFIFNNLKKKGKPIPINDIWIASSAMQNGLAVYSLDKHFSNIDGLSIL